MGEDGDEGSACDRGEGGNLKGGNRKGGTAR